MFEPGEGPAGGETRREGALLLCTASGASHAQLLIFTWAHRVKVMQQGQGLLDQARVSEQEGHWGGGVEGQGPSKAGSRPFT